MVAYRASDVKLSWEHNDGGNIKKLTPSSSCGYIKEGLELEDDHDDDEDDYHDIDGPKLPFDNSKFESIQHFPQSIWKQSATTTNESVAEKIRKKRQADQYEYTPTKTRCPLLLVADYRFFQEMGGSNTKTTINYLISLIDRVHKIYNDTVWQDRSDQEGFKGMGFVIKKIVVHSEPTRVRGGEAHYNMVREKWDVRNLLEVRLLRCKLKNYMQIINLTCIL